MVRYLFVAVLFFSAASCATLPKSFQTKDEIIAVGPGPEDMVIDTISEQPRILLSTNSRRKGEKDYGEIEAYYPETNKHKILKRVNEPAGLSFNHHPRVNAKKYRRWKCYSASGINQFLVLIRY